MKKFSKIIVIVLMSVLGTCMHFVCDLVSDPTVVKYLGIIFPVNETSWEHMKMIWYPFLVAGILLSLIHHAKGYFGGMVIAGFAAMAIQLGLFSFYQACRKKTPSS